MHWEDIQKVGREIYKLSEEWHLCAADASDPFVMQIEFGKKGPRGGWLKGKENKLKGYISNYKERIVPTDSKPAQKEQLNLFN